MYIWAKYFCQLVFLQFGSKLNLYVQYLKIEIYLEIRGCDNRAGSLITAVFYCSNNDILNKYLRYGCVHMQMAVYAGHYSGHYSENYSKQF